MTNNIIFNKINLNNKYLFNPIIKKLNLNNSNYKEISNNNLNYSTIFKQILININFNSNNNYNNNNLIHNNRICITILENTKSLLSELNLNLCKNNKLKTKIY